VQINKGENFMSRRGKRYDDEPKLNIKKVVAVIIAILVVIMFIVGIKELLKQKDNVGEKVFALAYYTVLENDKWGVVDTRGNIVITPSYDEMIIIPDSTKAVFLCVTNVNYEDNTYTTKVLNEKNQEIFTNYDNDSSNNLWYEENILKVQKNGKYGLINFDGKELLAPEYDEINPVLGVKNVVITVKDGKQGIVNNIGNTIIDNLYTEITALTDNVDDGFIVKAENGKYGVINYNSVTALEPQYEEIKNVYGNSMYVVKEANKWKIVNTSGEEFLTDKFDDVKSINIENVIYEKNGKYGVTTIHDETKIEPTYDDLTYAFTDTYIAKKNDVYGIINLDNEQKVQFIYSSITYNSEADFFVAQREDSTSDLLDRNFEVKATGIISQINTSKNYIRIRVGENYKYYNFKLEEKENTEILSTSTLFLSKKDGKYGYVNSKGIVVVDYIYDDATEQNKYGYVAVKKDGKWGALDQTGKVIVEPKYDMENNLYIDFIDTWYLAEDLNANYYTK
jgi:hypothetical protein